MWLKELVRPYYLRWLYFKLFPERVPPYFRQCWNFPPAAAVSATTAPAFLFLPMTDWHARIQRTQHLARALSALGHHCLVLNPHLGREFPQPYPFPPSSRLLEIEPHIAELHVHLPREPVYHHRPLSAGESARIARAIRAASDPGQPIIQVVSFPVWSGVARQLRREFGYPILYDCHDWLAGFRGIAPELIEEEYRLLAGSDLALFSAEGLRQTHLARQPELAARSRLLRNAVDSRWLSQPLFPPPASPVIAYVGALDFWFDRAALELAARRHPEWEFRLIGRIEDPSLQQLGSLSNIRFIGELPHHDLPSAMAACSAGMIPFLVNDLTLGTNPIKLYEYFSCGLPVVSSRLPEIEEFGGARLSGTPEQFVAQLEAAIAEDSLVLRRERRRRVSRETWEDRAIQLLNAATELSSRV